MSQESKRCDCLVIGGGIAGMESAITLGDMGFEVVLVEKEASIGGKMILLSKVFPTLDCASCISTPKMAQTANHPRVKVLTYAEIKKVERLPEGGFKVTVRKKPTYVDPTKCTGCGQCEKVCTVGRPDQFQDGLVARKAIYIPFPQAVPKKAVIEKKALSPCSQSCPAGLRPHGLVALTRAGKIREVYLRALKDSPFPGILCRLCAGFCESRCTRGRRDKPLPIRNFVTYAARTFFKDDGTRPSFPKPQGERIALLGSGPEALTVAYFLARRGYVISVFDEEVGKVFADWGAPAWLLKEELKNLEAAGVNLVSGKPKSPATLKEEGFRLVLNFLPPEEGEEFFLREVEEGVFQVGGLIGEAEKIALAARKGQEIAALFGDFLEGKKTKKELLEASFSPPKLPAGAPLRNLSFVDVIQAQEEARRCLDCGVCSECHQCLEACPAKAIDFSMKPEEITYECGAVILATGFKLFDPKEKPLTGYTCYPNVITGMQMDRLLAPTRPYNWVLRPSDGKLPGNIAIVLCVGSRDRTGGTRACSRICCMYSIKQAQLIMGALPIAEITIYYIDIRAFGKGYEEFFQQAKAMGVHFVKGKVARIEETKNNDLILYYEDMEGKGGLKKARHDLVVLATGALAQTEVIKNFRDEGPQRDEFSFIQEKDEDLEPGCTSLEGVFAAGAACGPRDIPDSVLHAGATVAQVAAYLKRVGWK